MIDASPDTHRVRRWLFVTTILAGSFLLFLVQPMVARMALPRLGGAPNVWNSAMLVYQALLLGGYAYAHFIGRFTLMRQGMIHLVVLLIGALTLPLALADISSPSPGWEALWVPWLFLLTVGPAFFAVSAQAPLVQRWFAAHPAAGNPYPLYAASNLGSFAGLLAYPLLAEPLLTLGEQSLFWAFGYALLIALVGAAIWARRFASSVPAATTSDPAPRHRSDWRTVLAWLGLAAVPSGLMLSTTTFLTTDIMAMPLLWVIPLGLYLLSFSIAFAEKRALAGFFILIAPVVLLVDGSIAMFSAGRADLLAAIASVIFLFVVAVALHARLYERRPPPSELTRFYLVMSVGGALGGVFTALIAPVLFDWTWEHPLLLLAAAALLPLRDWKRLLQRFVSNGTSGIVVLIVGIFAVFNISFLIYAAIQGDGGTGLWPWLGLCMVAAFCVLSTTRRWSFVATLACLLLAFGGIANVNATIAGDRARSYFGQYRISDKDNGDRVLLHGTTIHGLQRSGGSREPTTYYGRTSGVGRALAAAPANARVGVVGLGVGTLACYRKPGQEWTFFEIDRLVLSYSHAGAFTFMRDCAPDARIMLGDARIVLRDLPANSFDTLVIDAFSSDAIPLHLLTEEAMDIYADALADDGLLVIHISNRYIRLEPVIARLAQNEQLFAMALTDPGEGADDLFSSTWIAVSPSRGVLDELSRTAQWRRLEPPEGPVWTDDYASVLPYFVWENFL